MQYGPITKERHERRQRYEALVAAAEAVEVGRQVHVLVRSRAFPEGERIAGVVTGSRGARLIVETPAYGALSVAVSELVEA